MIIFYNIQHNSRSSNYKPLSCKNRDHVLLKAIQPTLAGGDSMSSPRRNIRPTSLRRRRRVEYRQGRAVLIRRVETVAAAEDEIVLIVDDVHRPRELRRRRRA